MIDSMDVDGVHVEGRWTPRGYKTFVEIEGVTTYDWTNEHARASTT